MMTFKVPSISYEVPLLVYPLLGLGSYNHKVGYPEKGLWYEPTRRQDNGLSPKIEGIWAITLATWKVQEWLLEP